MQTGPVPLVTSDAFLDIWQGHRRLTRKVIQAFPEDRLFEFSIGGMRTFGDMVLELLGLGLPAIEGVATGVWPPFGTMQRMSKADLLAEWDKQTTQLNERFPQIPVEQFTVVQKAFGMWEMPGFHMLQYAVDNEIHHRGEGYVYLRALGVEPPAFYDRA